jgi:hypothetical protein
LDLDFLLEAWPNKIGTGLFGKPESQVLAGLGNYMTLSKDDGIHGWQSMKVSFLLN